MPVSNALPYYNVESYELVETTGVSELVANFARVHILLSLFDGDAAKWIEFIERDGTAEEREHDLPFAVRMLERLRVEPSLLARLRAAVQELSRLLGPAA